MPGRYEEDLLSASIGDDDLDDLDDLARNNLLDAKQQEFWQLSTYRQYEEARKAQLKKRSRYANRILLILTAILLLCCISAVQFTSIYSFPLITTNP